MEQESLQLNRLTYYRTGGACQSLMLPRSVDELQENLRALQRGKVPYFVLGAGSNSLVWDDPWDGAVIAFRSLTGLSQDGALLRAQAGVANTELCRFASRLGLDAAWMAGLPGEIGATVRMNARCYGGEMSQIVRSVQAVDGEGNLVELAADPSLFLGYKDTVFMHSPLIVVGCALQLPPRPREEIAAAIAQNEADRRAKGHFLYPSCGCVFKNNHAVGVPGGMLLEHAGVHGLNSERVQVNPHHANFVFNLGASSREILEVTLAMREAVYVHFGVWLEYEMEILGRLPRQWADRIREVRPQQPREDALAPLRALFLSQRSPQPGCC